jgi:uncharacterized YccA/Bax inhibitor family protein
MERSSNPALRDNIFTDIASFDQYNPMTIEGTIDRTVILLGLVLVSSMVVWNGYDTFAFLLLPAAILGLVLGIFTIFKREYAPYTAPAYAVVEGAILGLISGYMNHMYPGIVIQAVSLTFGVFFVMLLLFRFRILQATEKFKIIVIAATGSIVLLYLADIVLGLFGHPVGFIHESSLIGIGFSLIVIVIAALNLILDFDFIEKGAEHGAPKYLEWYAAFALLVTLIWLYLEILRLLGKMRR